MMKSTVRQGSASDDPPVKPRFSKTSGASTMAWPRVRRERERERDRAKNKSFVETLHNVAHYTIRRAEARKSGCRHPARFATVNCSLSLEDLFLFPVHIVQAGGSVPAARGAVKRRRGEHSSFFAGAPHPNPGFDKKKQLNHG